MTMRGKYKYLVYVAIITALVILWPGSKEEAVGHPRDYDAIQKEGILRVATEYNSISFFVDGDTVSGFHYELIEAFALNMGLKAKVSPVMSFSQRVEGLGNGTYDVIANDLLATSELKDSLLLTSALLLNKEVLVQRKANEADSTLYIKSLLDLAGRTLHVVKGSPSTLRIRNLSNEIGDTIYVKEIEKYGSEQLTYLVAHGNIDYAVCDGSIARAAADSLPQLDINTAISFTQFYSWAVSKQSPVLLDSLNSWLNRFRKSKSYNAIYKKYYGEK